MHLCLLDGGVKELLSEKLTIVRNFQTYPVAEPQLISPSRLKVHAWPLVHRNESFGCWWAIAQCTVSSLSVLVFFPFSDALAPLKTWLVQRKN